MDHYKVTKAIEAMCNLGCTSVNAIIHTLEQGQSVEGIEGFSETEKQTLMHELKAIMSVYDYRVDK